MKNLVLLIIIGSTLFNIEFEYNKIDSFTSKLDEPWNKLTYSKKVFKDFKSTFAFKFEGANYQKLDTVQIVTIRESDKLSSFLKEESKLTNLEALQVVNTEISTQTFELILAALKTKKHFKKLILFNCEIDFVPKSIVEIKQLNTLDLSKNKIKSLPSTISGLLELKYLRLYNNRNFNIIPKDIGDLKNLELLDFAGTNVKEIPKSIGSCKKLVHLTGNASKIQGLPSEIGDCKFLKYINLGHNSLTKIPEEIGNLPLEFLVLSGNKIKQLPKSLSKLENLWYLSLAKNNLSSFPDEILSLENLVNLTLNGNRIIQIPFELSENQSLISLVLDDKEELKPFIKAIKEKNSKVRITEKKD